MPVRYVIRAFGGTLILGAPSATLPTVLVVAHFRSGTLPTATFRSSQTSATFRSGQATGEAR